MSLQCYPLLSLGDVEEQIRGSMKLLHHEYFIFGSSLIIHAYILGTLLYCLLIA